MVGGENMFSLCPLCGACVQLEELRKFKRFNVKGRIIVKVGWGATLHEATVLEVVPSGEWVKLK